jgi:hypothetical protein
MDFMAGHGIQNFRIKNLFYSITVLFFSKCEVGSEVLVAFATNLAPLLNCPNL